MDAADTLTLPDRRERSARVASLAPRLRRWLAVWAANWREAMELYAAASRYGRWPDRGW